MARRRPVVLSQPERAFFEQNGGKKWLRGKLFRDSQKARYERALDAFAEKLGELGIEPHDPETLQQLLKVVLARDGTMGAWFRNHNADVGDDETFARLCKVAAGAIIEEYLHTAEPREPDATLVLDAELKDQISALLELAVEQGELSAREGRDAGEDWWTIENLPDLVDDARGQLEDLLVSDVNVAHTASPDVPESEREREIAKAALLQLKITQLRRIARDADLPLLRDREALADLIVRKYGADRAEIAELVLRYSVPDVERGWVTRLVPLRASAELSSARRTLPDLPGKYLRLEVASWLVFHKAEESHDGASFEGEIMYYAVRPQREGERLDIAALQRTHPIAVKLKAGQAWVAIDGRSAMDVRRLRKALRYALGVHLASSLDSNVPSLEGELGSWDRVTLRMLYILEHGLRDAHLDYSSFRQAEFSQTGTTVADPQQPSVRAVRLQGQHVMADPAACRNITSGQTLHSVDVRVRWQRDLRQTESFYTTIRIGLAADNAYVMTAFGESPSKSRDLHRVLVERLRRALERDFTAESLAGIVRDISKRAVETGPPEVVDILGPALAESSEISAHKRTESEEGDTAEALAET